MNKNTLRAAVRVSPGLVSEIEVDVVGRARSIPLELCQHFYSNKGLAGPIHAVQEIDESLRDKLGHSLADRLPDQVGFGTAGHLAVFAIDEPELVIGAAQQCHCGGSIADQIAKAPQLGVGRLLSLFSDLEDGRDADQKLAGTERFDDVIVGAGAQSFDARFFARAGREQDHRRRAEIRVAANSAEQLEAVHAGHHHIRKHEIRPIAPNCIEGRISIRDRFHLVQVAQEAAKVIPHVGVIVCHEYPRARPGAAPQAVSQLLVWRDQPALSLFDERLRAQSGGRTGRTGAHFFARQMAVTERYRYRESAALAFDALDADAAAVEPRQFMNQRETDSRSFPGAALDSLDAVKPLKYAADLGFRNSHAGVADRENGLAAIALE